MLIVVPAAAAAAIVLTVAGNCGRNMLQTYRVVAAYNTNRNANDNAGTFTVLFPQQQQQQSSSSSSLVQTVTQQRGMAPTDEAQGEDDARDVLTQLQAMTRQQLLEVFVQGSTPLASFEDIYGEWNGCLLDNNGKIMTTVSNLMTHSLFASSFFSKMMHKLGTLWQQIKKPRKKGTASSSISSSSSSSATRTSTNYKTRWNGKSFFAPSSSTKSKEGNNAGTTVTTARTLGRGSNRFERTLRNNMDTTTTTTTTANSSSSSRKQHNKDKAAPVVFTKHDFEYCLQESALGLTTVPPSHTHSNTNTNININSNTSLCLKYTNYQAPLSLWYTMQDELRIVTLPKTVLASNETQQQQQQQVLLGIGYMAWSGGIWNASPFVLWRA